MNILVFSDTHANTAPMMAVIREKQPDLILHLGDYDRDVKIVARGFPHIPLRVVAGNCDPASQNPVTERFTVARRQIIMTHGHHYNVKLSYKAILHMAQAAGADILLFGHTHIPYYEQVGDIQLLNPGSAGTGLRKSCGLIQIADGEIRCGHLPL